MSDFDIIINMWDWFIQDIIGNEIIASIVVVGALVFLFTDMGLPFKVVGAFMVPVALGMFLAAYMTWFAWLMIMIAGAIMGVLALKLVEQ